MIITKYPEWVEAQLKILDEGIEEIYREYMNVKLKPDDAMWMKQNLAERIKPFVDEKVRLISNSYPRYETGEDTATKEEKECTDCKWYGFTCECPVHCTQDTKIAWESVTKGEGKR